MFFKHRSFLCLMFSLALLLLALLPQGAAAYEGEIGYAQMLINKSNVLPSAYAGGDLVNLGDYMRISGTVQMSRPAAEALQRMYTDMKDTGLSGLYGTSGYRSYSTQSYLYQRKINQYRASGYGQAEAERLGGQVVAPPGASEHQSGLAIDVTAGGTGLTESFYSTPEGKWLDEHCWEYGFILRYPEDRTGDTGYIYEPWHFRYVGQPHAEYIHRNNLILEDYIAKLRTEGVIGMVSSQNGQAYAIYYCEDLASVDALPGQLLSVSFATPARNSYIVTTLAVASTLYDIVGHWAEENIRHLVMLDIVTGYTDNTFRPGRNISRAELVTLTARTYRLLFQPQGDIPGYLPYTDVLPSDYFYPSLWLCYNYGLLPRSMQVKNGVMAFSPNQQVLRWEAAEALAPLFAFLPEAISSGITFGDMLDASPELRHAVQLLADYGILTGDLQGNFNPDATITRAEISAMLDRILWYFYNMNLEEAESLQEGEIEDNEDENEDEDEDEDDDDDRDSRPEGLIPGIKQPEGKASL
ncbi:MAG: D-alanyl-D-alanine carboxypeptidase family protein [Bacillota bacterium]|nr:D-alanyl-D-alanine carboxypeptidase family protein [Bacillota bacterium]